MYSVLESPYRWPILAGLAFLTGVVGCMVMFAYDWPHPIEVVWLLAGVVLSAIFLLQLLLEWKGAAAAQLEQSDSTYPVSNPNPATDAIPEEVEHRTS